MHIHTPEVSASNGWVRLEARVETETPFPRIPETVYFAVPEVFAPFVHPGMEAFACATLQFAMALGEDLILDGPLSAKLAFNLDRFQDIFHTWHPRTFCRVNIVPTGYHQDDNHAPGPGAAQHFSAGVDSFYTLMKLLEPGGTPSGRPITHGIFADFNRKHHSKDNYQQMARKIETLFHQLGLELIRMDTNLRLFNAFKDAYRRTRWVNLTFGGGLAALGLVLRKGISWLYIPSGMPITYTKPDGSQLLTDHLLSTESLEVINHPNTISRGGKVEAISTWPHTYNLLNVCWWNTNGAKNCSRCPKCTRTMAYLDIFNRLDRYSVFGPPRQLLRLKWFVRPGELKYTPEIRDLARKHHRWVIYLIAAIGTTVATVLKWGRSIVQRFFPDFHKL